MPQAFELSDDEFLAALSGGRLSPQAFDHPAHLRLAWLLVRRHSLAEAVDILCDELARFAARAGAPEKFHWTVSEALVRLVAHHDRDRATASWRDFLREHGRLVTDARGLVAEHYSPERLADPEARRGFLPPDRRPLPPLPDGEP